MSPKALNLTEKDLFILVSLLGNGAQDIYWLKANDANLESLRSKGLVEVEKGYWVLTSEGRVWARLQKMFS
jgi:hypothetical protein